MEKKHFWKGFGCGAGTVILVNLAIIAGLFLTAMILLGRTDTESLKTQLRSLADRYLGPSPQEAVIPADDEDDGFLGELKAYIDYYFVLDHNEEEQRLAAKRAYVSGLGDPYSAFLTAEEFNEMMESSNGSYCGIGVQVQFSTETGDVTVVTVFKNSSAMQAGLQKGDIFRAVNGESIAGFDLDTVVSLIRGEEGTDVDVTLYRPSDHSTYTVTVTRRQVEIDTVEYRMLTEKTGYIRLSEFDEVSVNQVADALKQLKKQGMQKLVFDLRDNPGGLLSSVLGITDLFLNKGQLIFYMEDKQGKEYRYSAAEKASFGGDLIVLVNGGSASASEVFSGAIKDNERGTLMGEQTFGKGIVQSFFKMSDGSYVKLTSEHYCTPSGADIHGTGIAPHIAGADDPATEEDELIAAALKELGE